MPCPCLAIRNFVAKIPGGSRIVSMLPELPPPPNRGVKEQSDFVLHRVSRLEVLLEAQSWVGTPYHHMARVKGAGADCGQLPLGVYHNAGCIPHIKTHYYPPDFFLHRDHEWYRGIVEEWADEIPEESVQPADLVLYRFGRLFAHGAIVVDWPNVIHACRGRGVVHDIGVTGQFRMKERAFFSPKAFSV